MILQIYTIIQTLISLVAIFTSFVILFGMLATAPLPWLIFLTHDLPSSFALSGLPVHVAASQRVPFSLGGITLFTVSEQTTKQRKKIL